MKFPAEILDFTKEQITLEVMALPWFYPDEKRDLAEFQEGYKEWEEILAIKDALKSTQSLNEFLILQGCDLKGVTTKECVKKAFKTFESAWLAIAQNYYADVFFVDLRESKLGYPVYFAYHGAGSWTPILAAQNLSEFRQILLTLRELEADKTRASEYVKANFNLQNELWAEVYESLNEPYEPQESVVIDESKWIRGNVVIKELGKNKMKVLSLIARELHLSLADALNLARGDKIIFKTGYLLHLEGYIEHLNKLGATAKFEPESE